MRYIAYATNETTYTRIPFNTKMGARYMAERLTEKPYNWPKAQVIDTETGEILCEIKRTQPSFFLEHREHSFAGAACEKFNNVDFFRILLVKKLSNFFPKKIKKST